MPRDLETEAATLDGMAPLTKEAASESEPEAEPSYGDNETYGMPGLSREYSGDLLMHDMQKESMRDQLHPYQRTLTLSDVDSCLKLEEATFPPQERCTREKFEYRFAKCGELCVGIFTSAGPDSADQQAATAATAGPAESAAPERKGILLAHAVVTKSRNLTVKDEDMAFPSNWREEPLAEPHLGHKEDGRTACLHSLAVLPRYQRRGLGTILIKAYIERISHSGVADRVALITHEKLVPFYKRFGFVDKGKSDVQFGGGSWNDMVLELEKQEEKDKDKEKGKLYAKEKA